ncbi:hypothetical protein L1887_32278 [Cichorium endivia]|nr:hypothetical protein L1887_32278 [Cichorium endivia]
MLNCITSDTSEHRFTLLPIRIIIRIFTSTSTQNFIIQTTECLRGCSEERLGSELGIRKLISSGLELDSESIAFYQSTQSCQTFFDPPPAIPVSVLQDIVSTAIKHPKGYTLTLHDGTKTVLNKKVFAEALHLPYHETTFDHPTNTQLESMIYQMGYLYDLPRLFQMSKGHISPLWQCLIHYIIKCLTGKMGGTYQLSKRLMELLWSLFTGYENNHAEILFEDFLSYIPTSQKPKGKIHTARFWDMCIDHIHQTLHIPIPQPRSDEDKLVMPEAKPYAPKTDSIFGKIRKLPDSLLSLADPSEPAVIFHLSATQGPSEPSSKDSESEKLEERQNSHDSEDTQGDMILDTHKSPPKEKEKATETNKDTPLITIISDPTQPPSDASEFDVWRFRTAVNEQDLLVELLKTQFDLKIAELQNLSALGPPTDADSDTVKAERKRIKALTLQIDSFLSASLKKLVDTPIYLFDTTEQDWSKIASDIVPLTWNRFTLLNPQKTNTTLEQPAESGYRLILSESHSIPGGLFIFRTDQEVNQPQPTSSKVPLMILKVHQHPENFSNSESDLDSNKTNPSGLRKSPVSTIFINPLSPRPLTDSDFKPLKTYNPHPTYQHNWDIPLTPNGDKYVYSLNFAQTPGFNKELETYHRNQKFLNICTKPQVETWSIDPITVVRSLKKRSFPKANYYEYEIIRNNNYDKPTLVTEADFRMMNPADIFSIVRKLSTKEYQTLFPEKVDLSMPEDRDHWKRGTTFDPVLGLVYKNPKQKGSLFFLRADQIRRLPSVNLNEYIKAIKKSQSSNAEAKKELLLRVEWLLRVRNFWSYAVRQGVLDKP